MIFDRSIYCAGHARIYVLRRCKGLLKPNIFFLMFVFSNFIVQASLAQQTQSKSRTKDAREPKTTVQELRAPASVAEAATAIDLSTFPLLPNVLEIHARSVACLEYVVGLKAFDVRSEYEFQRRALLERKWQELPDGDGQFTHSGFHLYMTVQMHDEPGKAVVKLQNNGNVNVSKLPVPSGARYIKTAHNVADFEATASVNETRESVRALLIEQGWQPYGTRGDAMDMKQNAVLLTAVVSNLRQPGLTRIAYWTTQMPSELPVPPNSESILYQSDHNHLELVAAGNVDAVSSYYKSALRLAGWNATTDSPNREDQQLVLIFHNPAKDTLRLGMRERTKERTRVTLKYQSFAENEELARKR